MRRNLTIRSGGSGMKLQVACLLVLATFTSGAVGQRQNLPRSQKTVSVPRTQTIRICQGVPIPDGYVVVAYMTSTACPHGAYILKKQDQSESSLAISRKASASATDDSGTGPNSSGNRSLNSRNSSSAKSFRDREPRSATGSNEAAQAPSNGPQSANVTSAGNVASRRKWRRVDRINPQANRHYVIGAASAPMAPRITGRRPRTAIHGYAPLAADPTPEEVDETISSYVDTMLVTCVSVLIGKDGLFALNAKTSRCWRMANNNRSPIFETAEKPRVAARYVGFNAFSL